MEGYYSTSEVLGRLGVTTSTLYRWMDDPSIGFPRPVKLVGRNHFPASAVEAWWAGIEAHLNEADVRTSAPPLSEPITEYRQLIEALRARRQRLGLSQMELELRSGLQTGYVSKLEAPIDRDYARGLGSISMPLMLKGLGCALVLVENKAEIQA